MASGEEGMEAATGAASTPLGAGSAAARIWPSATLAAWNASTSTRSTAAGAGRDGCVHEECVSNMAHMWPGGSNCAFRTALCYPSCLHTTTAEAAGKIIASLHGPSPASPSSAPDRYDLSHTVSRMRLVSWW